LARYREFARDGFERPNQLRELRRWRQRPSFYIRTVHEDTGAAIPAPFVAAMHAVIRNTVTELSGGIHRDAVIEAGTESRQEAPGWVIVTFRKQLMTPSAHGQATVGGESGWLALRFDDDSPRPSNNFPDRCPSYELQVLEHELTHTMGFWHTSVWADGSAFNSLTGCTGADRSESARHLAAIVYARAPGNLDVDVDRTSFAISAERSPISVQECGEWQLRLSRPVVDLVPALFAPRWNTLGTRRSRSWRIS
jgi:hypothetical protein